MHFGTAVRSTKNENTAQGFSTKLNVDSFIFVSKNRESEIKFILFFIKNKEYIKKINSSKILVFKYFFKRINN